MGCDIHLILEQNVGDKWVGISTFESLPSTDPSADCLDWRRPAAKARNYRRFNLLAGVRGDEDGPPPKGIPSDASDLARMVIDEWGVDGHSHFYLSLPEALPIFVETFNWSGFAEDDWRKKRPADFFFPGVNEEYLDSYRLVFFFDN